MSSFGPFKLTDGSLLREGKTVAIGQRALSLLEALTRSDGPVDKAALIEAAWPGTIVEEGNLTVQVAALRKALGTRPDGQEWIVTVPRVGYRLLRDVAVRAEVVAGPPSLAVLPFVNLSSDPQQDYFADAVAEDIITALSRFKSFQTIARNSSFVYKGRAVDVREVAEALGVAYVIEGSVRTGGGRLRVVVQLADAQSGAHLWGHNFDGTVEDIFEVQERIAETVAAQIEPKLLPAELARARRERVGSEATYDRYLEALARIDTGGERPNSDGLRLLEQVLARDPDCAPAVALASHALERIVTQGWSSHGSDDARQAVLLARHAIDLAPNDSSILARCSMALVMVAREFDNALVVLDRALAANPNDALAVHHAAIAHVFCGDLALAEQFMHRVIRVNLSSSADLAMIGLAHIRLIEGKYEEALEWATRAQGVNPHTNPAYWMLIAANVHLGRMDEAHKRLAILMERVPESRVSSLFGGGKAARYPERITPITDALRRAGMPD